LNLANDASKYALRCIASEPKHNKIWNHDAKKKEKKKAAAAKGQRGKGAKVQRCKDAKVRVECRRSHAVAATAGLYSALLRSHLLQVLAGEGGCLLPAPHSQQLPS
jgi:hypothetical protein